MAAIDLIVLGMLKQESLSAYDIQKLVEYRNISKWVKISTPSIYKKVIQLEEKGYITRNTVQGENLADKAIYSLTEAGEREFEALMFEISEKPIHIFLDFNAVIVNLMSLTQEKQIQCLEQIESNIQTMKAYMQENIDRKENSSEVSEIGMAVLQQQFVLAQTIESWIRAVKEEASK